MPGVMHIAVSLKDQELEHYEFDRDVVTVGRGQEADVVIDNVGISRCHASIESKDGGVWVRDLGSSNGTYVNATRVMHGTALHRGDVVRIGKFSIAVSLKDQAVPASAPQRPSAAAAPPDGGTIMLSQDDMDRLRREQIQADALRNSPRPKAPENAKHSPREKIVSAPRRSGKTAVLLALAAVLGGAITFLALRFGGF